MVQHYEVITKQELLSEQYMPSEIIDREKELESLYNCLEPLLRKKKPLHAWIFGESGTGKTLAARHILRKFKERSVKGVYVNCWETPSFFSILDKLTRELKILGAENQKTAPKLERLQQHLEKMPFIIILDEIDRIKNSELKDILYNLSTLDITGLVCISKSIQPLEDLDERIVSRLSPVKIAFYRFSVDEIYAILHRRAMFCLRQGVYNEGILKSIAQMANGNAREALQILKTAAYTTEREGSERIKTSCVKMAQKLSKHIKKADILNRLTQHHKILYLIVKEKREILSGPLWILYLSKCRELNVHPASNRSYSDYVNTLIDLNLIEGERARVKGKVRLFRVCD